ncbi:MAG: hypothetical protein ACYDEV_13695 [Acidiferrobacter sp.]
MTRIFLGGECGLGVVAATTSFDYAQAGYRQLLTGTYTPTLGQQVLTDLGLSPTTAAWTYAAMSLGAGVSAASAFSAVDRVGREVGSARLMRGLVALRWGQIARRTLSTD